MPRISPKNTVKAHGRELLCVYESEKAIVRIYTGELTDTPEKRRDILEKAAQQYASAIRNRNPEYFEKISWEEAEQKVV